MERREALVTMYNVNVMMLRLLVAGKKEDKSIDDDLFAAMIAGMYMINKTLEQLKEQGEFTEADAEADMEATQVVGAKLGNISELVENFTEVIKKSVG